MVAEVRSLSRPLSDVTDLDPLVARVHGARFVCIGEASHGTSEYYQWRALLSRRLIEEHGFSWIGVEGDWPDCWRINQWVKGEADQHLDAVGVLSRFERWPTWMWANREVADFLTWLHAYNLARPGPARVGFYGLDVYSLWDSLWEVMGWLEANSPDALPTALRAWQCFVPFGEDPHLYARSTRLVPTGCEPEVVRLLVEVRRRARETLGDEEMLDVVQNAEVAANAEHYYRTMVRGDRQSWNVRDHHMVDTIERLARHGGQGSMSRTMLALGCVST
jgi:erythromycin esterase-like protein